MLQVFASRNTLIRRDAGPIMRGSITVPTGDIRLGSTLFAS